MNLKPDSIWYLNFSGVRQVLFYSEWPRFHFKINEKYIKDKKEDRKKVLEYADHSWDNIFVELPTRLIPKMEDWIKNGGKNDIVIGCVVNNNVVQEWFVQGADIINIRYGMGRTTNVKVLVAQISYGWARRQR